MARLTKRQKMLWEIMRHWDDELTMHMWIDTQHQDKSVIEFIQEKLSAAEHQFRSAG